MSMSGNEITGSVDGIMIDTIWHIIPTPFVEVANAKRVRLRISDARLIFKKCRKVDVTGDRNLIDWRK